MPQGPSFRHTSGAALHILTHADAKRKNILFTVVINMRMTNLIQDLETTQVFGGSAVFEVFKEGCVGFFWQGAGSSLFLFEMSGET